MKTNIAVLSAFMLLITASCSDNKEQGPATSDDVRITSFKVTDAGLNDDVVVEGVIDGFEISLAVPYESKDELTVVTTAPQYVNVHPGSGTLWNVTDEVTYFYAQSGLKSSEYTVRVSKDVPQVPTVMTMSPVSDTGAEYKYDVDVRGRKITITTYEGRSQIVRLASVSMLPAGTTATINGSNAVGYTLDFDTEDTYTLIGREGGNEVRWTIDNVRVSPIGVDLTSPETIFDSSSGMFASMDNGNVRDAALSNGYVYYIPWYGKTTCIS